MRVASEIFTETNFYVKSQHTSLLVYFRQNSSKYIIHVANLFPEENDAVRSMQLRDPPGGVTRPLLETPYPFK